MTRPTPAVPAVEELTRRGYVVLAIDAYCFGERSGQGPMGEKGSAEELSMSKLNLWLGRSLWGMMVRDDLLALDYLASRPEVDPRRIGVTGMSMGSTRSWWVAALDERPAAAVCVCCLTRYQDLIAAGRPAGARHLLLCAGGVAPLRQRGDRVADRAAATADADGRPGRRFAGERREEDQRHGRAGLQVVRERRAISRNRLSRRWAHVYARDVAGNAGLV